LSNNSITDIIKHNEQAFVLFEQLEELVDCGGGDWIGQAEITTALRIAITKGTPKKCLSESE